MSRIVVQFEDFKNPFPALERYQHKYTCFNDDIQGTGAVVLAGIINAVKKSGVPVKGQRAVFMGAGSAGVGVAKQIVAYFMREGLTEEQARECFWLVDTKGLVTNDRGDKLADHKIYFSRNDNAGKQYKTLAEVVDYVKPTILMGLSTMGGIFSRELLKKMADWNKRPIIFPLSNPSANSECTFEDAVKYTEGRALFASGSPFPPETYEGQTLHPGQGELIKSFKPPQPTRVDHSNVIYRQQHVCFSWHRTRDHPFQVDGRHSINDLRLGRSSQHRAQSLGKVSRLAISRDSPDPRRQCYRCHGRD